MTHSANREKDAKKAGFFGYLFWKWLICLLLTLPSSALTLLVASLLGQTGGSAGEETGFLSLGPAIAAFVGAAAFFALSLRLFLRLKLGKLSCASFVFRESCAYGGVLLPCVLILVLTKGSCLTAGGISLLLLPHLPLAFLGKGTLSLLLPLFQLPLYAALAAFGCLQNRRIASRKLSRGEGVIEGEFSEKKEDAPTPREAADPSSQGSGGEESAPLPDGGEDAKEREASEK